MTGGCGNSAAGDMSSDNCSMVHSKAFRARTERSAPFFLDRVDRKAVRFVLHLRSHFCFGIFFRPTARRLTRGCGYTLPEPALRSRLKTVLLADLVQPMLGVGLLLCEDRRQSRPGNALFSVGRFCPCATDSPKSHGTCSGESPLASRRSYFLGGPL